MNKPVRNARNSALDLLARREHSRQELEIKLAKKEFSPEEIGQSLDQLTTEGLQSDQRFAADYVRHRSNKGFGPIKIAYELKQRGISDAQIQNALQQTEIDWFTQLCRQHHKKYGPEIPGELKQRVKQQRFLQNRGFATDAVMRLFREFAD